jgi:hypothetical protein
MGGMEKQKDRQTLRLDGLSDIGKDKWANDRHKFRRTNRQREIDKQTDGWNGLTNEYWFDLVGL